MVREHSDRQYEAELTELRSQISRMGASVAGMIEQSLRAQQQRDSKLAHSVIESDQEVNLLEVEIDELCLGLLARRQPVASDLRFITIGLKIVTDLERIGDLCVNICERTIELNAEAADVPSEDLARMSEEVRTMVTEAMEAFVGADVARAEQVIARDRTVDALYSQIFSEMLTRMARDPSSVNHATRIQATAKYLERIGDHATNLAEMVVFMVKGRDIRHLGRRASPERRAPHGVLFLCIHNAARSQMAEGWARKLLPPGVRLWSAGSQPAAAVHPHAVTVMKEIGIDISTHRPRRISDVPLGDVDTIVTLCAEEVCVTLPGEMGREIWVFPDPSAAGTDPESELHAFRAVRDGIGAKLQEFANKFAPA